VVESEDRLVPGGGRFHVRRCSNCGLAFTYPRDLDFSRHYPATSYHAYQEARDSHFNRLRLWLITRVPYGRLSRCRPGRLLDVGCGTGELAAAHRRQGWTVAGVEPSEEGAAVATGRGIDTHCGTLESSPWPDGTFDAIILNHSLEHMPEPRLALQRAHALLRDGGMLGISVPNFGSWQQRVFRSAWFQLDLPRHLQHFDERTLQDLVRRCGFEVVRTRSTSMMAGLLASIQYAVLGRRVVAGRLGRLLSLAVYPALAASDLMLEGDCLNLIATKRSNGARKPCR
jgi:2-polyprenyl-3-methyl-5-hydroxy-6-metoxy-1,4-benzoquinol methylase